jgi:hydrogenase-4 component E
MIMEFGLIVGLSFLLAVLSFIVIETRALKRATHIYAFQTLTLVFIFLALALEHSIGVLYIWAGTAFLTKVLLVPFLILKIIKKTGVKHEEAPFGGLFHPFISLGVSIVVAILLEPIFIKFSLLKLQIPIIVSIFVFMMGILGLVFRKSAVKQILAYCLFENGVHLTLALTAYNAPETIEIGILTDAIFSVIIMGALAMRFFNHFGSLDTSQANELKG